LELYDAEATRKAILEKIVWLAENLKQEDSLLMFYARTRATRNGDWLGA
jgi:hypothetical protein